MHNIDLLLFVSYITKRTIFRGSSPGLVIDLEVIHRWMRFVRAGVETHDSSKTILVNYGTADAYTIVKRAVQICGYLRYYKSDAGGLLPCFPFKIKSRSLCVTGGSAVTSETTSSLIVESCFCWSGTA
mgnify:CR=1 FL=1